MERMIPFSFQRSALEREIFQKILINLLKNARRLNIMAIYDDMNKSIQRRFISSHRGTKKLFKALLILNFIALFIAVTALKAETSETTTSGNENSQMTTAPNDTAAAENVGIKFVTPVSLGDEGSITFKPGARLQVRFVHTKEDSGGNNDFFIRRLRMKGGGSAFGIANYYFEVKIDNTGRFDVAPVAQVENCWLDFPVVPGFAVRGGLYDFVFSRSALTSDSKGLFQDRTLIYGALATLGFADNAIGILLHGRPFGGHFGYSGGVFDNVKFNGIGTEGRRQAEGVMQVLRAEGYLLDPAPAGGYADYRESYVGKGKRLDIAANVANLSNAQIGDDKFDIVAFGGDIFFNYMPFTLQGEYNKYKENFENDQETPDIDGYGWYAQAGYLFLPCMEAAVRYQELEPNKSASSDMLKWTSVGLNIYLRGHNLKFQTDYTFKNEQGSKIDDDIFQAQLQLDF
jgi:hypothetical protein